MDQDSSFIALKSQIVAALNDRFAKGSFGGETQGFTLIDGFITQSVQEQSKGVFLGGKSIPLVAVVGNSTGRVYYFALKALLPNITL